MERIVNPNPNTWQRFAQRPVRYQAELEIKVAAILEAVKNEGDQALQRFSQQFDGIEISDFKVTPQKISLSPELEKAIQTAAENIRTFHATQIQKPLLVETMPGVQCWRKQVGIEKVGLYIPGGTAPLFSTLLMLAIPAQLAGCKELVVCTPPQKNGTIAPIIQYTAHLLGIKTLYKVGGAQAIAAMAYGTKSIPKVDKIFGPGNSFVTMAKQLVQTQGTAIDMPAGPSEVLVIADESADASFVAADLLSQAEHGPDSQVILCTTSPTFADEVEKEIEEQLSQLPRKEIAEQALQNSRLLIFESPNSVMDFSNFYAPEHLILATENAEELSQQIINAGSVFLGNYSCESAGDYASGTNHTLPTSGYAKAYSGVSVDSFCRMITFQQLSAEGIRNIGPAIEEMAAAEGLEAHKNAVTLRLKKSGKCLISKN